MAVSREEIRIQLGIDNSKLTSGMSQAKGIVQQFSDSVMRMFTRIGAAFAAAFGAQRIIQSLRDVAQEIDELDDKLDIKRLMKEQRAKSLGEMSSADRESVIVGAVRMEQAVNAIKDALAIAAGRIAFLFETLSEIPRLSGGRRNISAILKYWDQASANVAKRHSEIVAAAKEAAAKTEAETKQREEQAKLLQQQKEAAAALAKQQAEAARAAAQELETRKRINAEMVQTALNQLAITRQAADLLRSFSDVPFSEAVRATDAAWGEFNLPPHRLSRDQMMAVRRIQMLEWQARQARIEGDPRMADELISQSISLKQQLGFLPQVEQDPFGQMRKDMRELNDRMAELVRMSKGEGLKVAPAD